MATTVKTKKPTDAEILEALRVMEECGARGDYAYEKLSNMLPKSKRPPSSFPLRADIRLIGHDDVYDMPDTHMNKVEAAVKAAWEPVTVKVGAKTYVVEFEEMEF